MAIYNPYTTNPYQNPYITNAVPYVQPIMYQQPVPQQIPANQTSQQTQFSNVWFDGNEDDAKMFPVGPNNAVALWSTTNPVIYLKKADSTGKPELIIYDIAERKTEETEVGKTVSYAREEDVASLINVVKSLGETVGQIQSDIAKNFAAFNDDIDKMKSDMYGIAGKKSISRKAEVRDE